MKKTILSLLCLLVAICDSNAQCTYKNQAFSGYEGISYNLYFNWQFVWVKAGTASMVTQPFVYNGKKAFRTSLTTKSSKRVDKYFMMRDTIMAYFSPELTPLYYRKGAREGKRYYVDEVWYSYPNGKCKTTLKHLHSDGTRDRQEYTYNTCVSDMINSFQRIRNLDPSNWKVGHTENISIAGGSELAKARIVYKGKKTIKGDNGVKYQCLILTYNELDDKKYKEIVRFYVTDDKRHIPVRLDLNLKFGSAKAFLSSIKGQ
jgi:hypothetical protein